MSKIFIHLGAHKTATSFLQTNLVANAAAFEKQGWRVIWLQKEFKKARRNVVEVRRGRQPDAEGAKHLDELFEEIQNDPRNIFLSYEGFLGSSNMTNGEVYANHAAPMKVLKDGFPGRRVQVGFCIRNFADMAESSYNSRLARGKMKKGFAKYARGISTEKLSWLKIIEQMSETFGTENLVLWTFEDFKRDSIAAFAKIVQAAGIDTTDIAPATTDPSNVSLSIPHLKLLRAWQKALRKRFEVSPKEARVMSRKFRKLLKLVPPTTHIKGLLSPEQRQELTERYEREVAAIRERWGDRMLDFASDSPKARNPASKKTMSLQS